MIIAAVRPVGLAALPPGRPVIVFDGHCVMCSRGAQFVLRHDRRAHFRLTTAQGEVGRSLYRAFGIAPDDLSTMLVVEGDRAALRSDAVIAVGIGLGWPWRAAVALRLLPGGLRDQLYDVVARNRLRWFGQRETCWMPSPAEADRIL